MTFDVAVFVVGGLGCAVVLASGFLRHVPVTEPLLALVTGVALGPEVLGLVEFEHGISLLHHVSEIGVTIALMAVALRFPFSTVRRLWRPLLWVVGVGMCLMAAVVAGLAGAILGIGLGGSVLLGGVLAPTDPVLSSSIVTGDPARRALPERVRALLSAESGFNDGLALPLVVAGMALVRDDGPGRFAVDGLGAVLIAVVVGALLGTAAGELFRRLDQQREIEDSAFFVFALVLGLAALGLVNLLGGDGILAVIVTGLAYNRQVGESIYEQEREVEEGINQVLVLPLFVLLGIELPWREWAELGAPLVGFTVAVLLLRRLPVIALLHRALHFDRATTSFYGWFGPMGAAALFFATMAHEKGATTPEVWPAAALVVAASTVLHGITAAPGRAAYGRLETRD